MKSTGLVIFCALLLAGCGKPTGKTPTRFIYPSNFSNNIVSLKKQVPTCTEKSFANALLEFPSFQDSFMSWPEKDFSPVLQGIFLKDGQVISEMTFDEAIDWTKVEGGYQVETIRKPKALFVCPSTTIYERATAEAAGLHAAYFIKKTNLKFTTLVRDVEVKPVSVSIGPEITESYLYQDKDGTIRKASQYLADNAYYAPVTQRIAFLPHSTFLAAFNLRTNFFEVPMIAAHEYGHHLFQMMYKYDYTPEGFGHHQGCFGGSQIPKPKPKGGMKRLDLRKVKIEDVVNAYNEGFADLVAFYSLDEAERGVRDVKCLEVSRDVKSTVFYDGKPKKFTEEAVRSFFSPYADREFSSCEDISFQSIHNFGAIFAHSADTFLSELTNSDDEKLLAVVEWVKFLRTARKRYFIASPERYFRGTMAEFVRLSMKRFDRKFDKAICQKIEDYFPSQELTECR